MKFCPKCRGQYDDEVRTCPDCGALLWNMTAAEEPEADAPVFLMQTTDARELELVEKMLEAQRVPFFVKDLETGEYMRIFMGFSVYGRQIYVRAGDYAYCSQLLARLQGDYGDEELDEAYDEFMQEVEEIPDAEQEVSGGGHRMLLGFFVIFAVLIVALLAVNTLFGK